MGRRSESLLDLLLEAGHAALAGIGDVDAIVLGAMEPVERVRRLRVFVRQVLRRLATHLAQRRRKVPHSA